MTEEFDHLPIEKWTVELVNSWLKSIGVKEEYTDRFLKEEVDGQVLLALTKDDLKTNFEMKSGPTLLVINKRNELIASRQRSKKLQEKQPCNANNKPVTGDVHSQTRPKRDTEKEKVDSASTFKRDCRPRPFGTDGISWTYIKHNVLQPESGIIDLIEPCHEYKSLVNAVQLDRTRLQAKFAKEVLKFAAGCMNVRSNGTIHFGVMDSRGDAGHVHGEITGIPVLERDIYVDALDYIERCFSKDADDARQCIRPPQFVEVNVGAVKCEEKRYVVEVDIEPKIIIVKNRVYSIKLPNFKETSNKVELEKATIYWRVGSKTEPVEDQNVFYQRVRDRDARREEAEHSAFVNTPAISQDLGRKLTMLVTCGKKIIEKEKWFILVTNKMTKEDLSNIEFLLNMKIFCVFDFDPDSNITGFCREYLQYHAANLHFLQNYKMPSHMSIADFQCHLHLFEQTSWIFCNGRNDFKGNEPPTDEMTWIRTKVTLLRECVSLICKQILPKGTFLVLFLLTAPVEKPLLHTFCEFFTDMEGHEDIICISESEENFTKWQSFAEGSCDKDVVDRSSVVGMKMSHVNATLQSVQSVTSRNTKQLPTFMKGMCILQTRDEERISSLEILSLNHCDETIQEFVEAEKENIESHFYRGGRVRWLNFWLADRKNVGEVIQRDAYREISNILTGYLPGHAEQAPVKIINVYHEPVSGGSTVARQVLWNNRKNLRCAVVKPSYSASNFAVVVCEHAITFREYDEKDTQKCLPVLLLIEDCDSEFLNDLKNELEVAINSKRIVHGTLCFILLSCRMSLNPQKMCKMSPLTNVAVTHRLSDREKECFAQKREMLEKQYKPEFILTFVLMSEGYNHEYVQKFVKGLLQGIDRAALDTRLILYVALLNSYVQNSFIPLSHCEALLALRIRMERFRQHAFENSLSEQARLVFVHLRDDLTYIEGIRIINTLVAKEILQQLLEDPNQQSQLAVQLLHEDVLFEHRFGKDDYVKFLRALFIRRCRISKGDESDSFFSPLIEQVIKNESHDKAVKLLKEAYKRFSDDPFFAQQLARLNYRHDHYEEAKYWAEIAAAKLTTNSYILDTKGRVYSRWFNAKCKTIEKIAYKTPENTADAVETALEAMECFCKCEEAAIAERETMNSSGFFGAVEVGCNLLKLIFSLHIFSSNVSKPSECQKYLLTDYIPESVKKPWEHFHEKLKNLQPLILKALEWISEDLSYFQTDLNTEEENTVESPEIKYPKQWLVSKSYVYGKYFGDVSPKASHSNSASLTPIMKRMRIFQLGGGTITTIFSLLAEQKDQVLEEIISLYPGNPLQANMSQTDIVNCIASHIALSCCKPQSHKVVSLQNLQKLSRQFPGEKCLCFPSALFLITLLFWPGEHDDTNERESKYEEVLSAVEALRQGYWKKMKDIPQRKQRIYTHFFLSNGTGLNKIVHKSKVPQSEKLSLPERRIKWFTGEVWKKPEIAERLKRVSGWTEDGTVYLEGPKKRKFSIPPLNPGSVPHGNENVTFYLGFTFSGPVALDITASQQPD
ncbi:sterile alpha motif domain-containing protein 9-like [Denticeps clupeoides]|uniref:SAM domain-containing protein n=1 Tax=Denticeps clupeoides TaxID=299321 RepID=A0AAY4BJ20_9TELE|nr:sterile alpha motif domain-containing protein 9-like [Denticeps clupeoides]XP_028845479.1 sterile alpha motif domain-containing protein 9-like [Denticeps clupeoides]